MFDLRNRSAAREQVPQHVGTVSANDQAQGLDEILRVVEDLNRAITGGGR